MLPGTSDEDFLRGIRSLPKVELHAHFGGSMRRTTVEELLRKQGRDDALERAAGMVMPRDHLGIPIDPTPFEPFQINWEAHQDKPEHVKRIVREYLQDCAADGIAYVELRTGGGNKERLITILDAFDEAKGSIDCIARLVVSLKRDVHTMVENELAVENAISLMDRGVVAIDFCGPPGVAADAPQGTVKPGEYLWEHPFTQEFADLVCQAQCAGMAFVPHFAEFPEEMDQGQILDAKPARLGHAICMSDDTWRRVKAAAVPIECCLVSNLNTMRRHSVLPPGDGHPAQQHPMVMWFRENHPFALCCDNVGLHQTSLSEHYALAAHIVSSSRESEQGNAWKMAFDAVEHILGGEDIKAELKRRLRKHPWCPETYQIVAAADASPCRSE